MKLSAKTRYALASVVKMAMSYDAKSTMTVLEIATELDISKIYLERVFSQLKHSGIVESIKGAQGGYYLAKTPDQITLYDVLMSMEATIFSENDKTVEETSPSIEKALTGKVYSPLNEAIKTATHGITLKDLAAEAQQTDDYMYYL